MSGRTEHDGIAALVTVVVEPLDAGLNVAHGQPDVLDSGETGAVDASLTLVVSVLVMGRLLASRDGYEP